MFDHLAGTRLRLIEAELARRAARFEADPGLLSTRDPNYEAWSGLAREVRPRADIVRMPETAGCWLARNGRGCWRGPCPVCGGDDRFQVWDWEAGESPHFWCRKCQIWGDAIDVYQWFLVPGESFHAAVRVLALELGLRTPDHGVNRQARIAIRERVSLGELRHAG